MVFGTLCVVALLIWPGGLQKVLSYTLSFGGLTVANITQSCFQLESHLLGKV